MAYSNYIHGRKSGSYLPLYNYIIYLIDSKLNYNYYHYVHIYFMLGYSVAGGVVDFSFPFCILSSAGIHSAIERKKAYKFGGSSYALLRSSVASGSAESNIIILF